MSGEKQAKQTVHEMLSNAKAILKSDPHRKEQIYYNNSNDVIDHITEALNALEDL